MSAIDKAREWRERYVREQERRAASGGLAGAGPAPVPVLVHSSLSGAGMPSNSIPLNNITPLAPVAVSGGGRLGGRGGRSSRRLKRMGRNRASAEATTPGAPAPIAAPITPHAGLAAQHRARRKDAAQIGLDRLGKPFFFFFFFFGVEVPAGVSFFSLFLVAW